MEKSFKKLCRYAGTAIAKYRLISAGDRILAAVSGGKDSMAMLHVLAHLQQAAPVKFTFEAATFDPGFPDFNAEKVAEYCRKQNWKHHIVKLQVNEILKEKEFENAPCVLCSRLRRGKLYGLAASLNCNKLALGQHIDDIAASFFMSVCRGQGLTTMAPKSAADLPEHPQVIRILALAPEQLIAEYAATLDLPDAGKCPYQQQLESGDRKYFKDLLLCLSQHIPDLRSNIARSLAHVELDHLMLEPDDEKSM